MKMLSEGENYLEWVMEEGTVDGKMDTLESTLMFETLTVLLTVTFVSPPTKRQSPFWQTEKLDLPMCREWVELHLPKKFKFLKKIKNNVQILKKKSSSSSPWYL